MKIVSERKTIADLNLNKKERMAVAKRLYNNAVLAVREIEAISNSADMDLSKTHVDWNSACELHSFLNESKQFSNYMDKNVKGKTVKDLVGAKELVQKSAYDFYVFNFAWENATAFRLDLMNDYIKENQLPCWYSIRRNSEQYDVFRQYITSITNEEGDFVYFADTDEPIVVKSMANGISAELKAKADANNGLFSVVDFVADMEVA